MTPAVRVRRVGGNWFVAMADGHDARCSSASEAVLRGLRWVLANPPAVLVLEPDFAHPAPAGFPSPG